MSLATLLMTNLAIVAGLMLGVWLLSLALRDASVVDLFWGFGFVTVAVASLILSPSESPRKWLVAVLAAVWGLRLSGYLTWRNHGKPEDYRYAAMRAKHGRRFWIVSLFSVFVLQGAIMWVVSLPLQAAAFSDQPLGMLDAAGVIVWAIGLIFETVGDYQLARFKADETNRGQVFDKGLWHYTRHPNYFGDFLVWWGFFLLALSAGAWWTLSGPALMSFLLMRVSGVTLLERSLSERKDGYNDYQSRTSSFFPWPPRPASKTKTDTRSP